LSATAGDIIGGEAITAATLNLNASGGIGIGTAVTAQATNYNLSTSGSGAAGNIFLIAAGPLNTNQINTLATSATPQTIGLAAASGDLTVGAALGNAVDSLLLVANHGSIVGTETLTANTLTLAALNGVGTGSALNTQVETLDVLNQGSGNIQVQEVDDVTVLRLENQPANDNDKATGTISLTAGGQMHIASGGGVTTQDGDISLEAQSLSIHAGLSTTNGGDVALRSNLAGISFTDAGDITLEQGSLIVDAASSLTLGSDTLFQTAGGRVSGRLLQAADPFAGSGNIGGLLSDTRRLAAIAVRIDDALGAGYGLAINWLEGDRPGPVTIPPADLRAQRIEATIDTAIVGDQFGHLYADAPNSNDPAADINVEIRLTQFARGTIELNSGGVSVLTQSKFSSVVTVGVSSPLLPFAPQLLDRPFLLPSQQAAPVPINLPPQLRSFVINATQQVPNSIGTTTQTAERYYVLRLVTFDEEGVQEQMEYRLKDLDNPDAEDGFELSQLPELFKRLPDDRYRIYMIDGQTEKLVLDFIIRDGQPVEAQDTESDAGRPADVSDSEPHSPPTPQAGGPQAAAPLESNGPLAPNAPLSLDAPRATAAEQPAGNAAATVGRKPSLDLPPPPAADGATSAVERLGSVPATSSAGILFGLGVWRSKLPPRRPASPAGAVERLGRRSRRAS
ncbi:MAG: hypothetical protein KDA45_11345, partial [Planctomycetales bacterium]|nr:hypothetical protein [Planctomycetales bacterium]